MKSPHPSLALALLAAIAAAPPAAAQDTGVDVRVGAASASYQALNETPIMVSVIKDGTIAQQQETKINSNAHFTLAPGTYDVRLEGDGAITITKRGVTVTAGHVTSLVGGPMRAGKGVRIVEYATGGLAREEVAARLARLDAAVDKLDKEVDSLKAARTAAH
jgi:hypothetical protein